MRETLLTFQVILARAIAALLLPRLAAKQDRDRAVGRHGNCGITTGDRV